MSQPSSTVAGLNLPTQQAMLAGNPRDSAIASQTAANDKLTALTKSVSGGRRRRHTRRRHRRNHHTRGRGRGCMCPCRVCRGCIYKIGTGRRSRRSRRGGAVPAGTVAVPQFTMQYTPTGGPGQDPNALIKQNSQISTQSAANAVYDKYATQKGGDPYGPFLQNKITEK